MNLIDSLYQCLNRARTYIRSDNDRIAEFDAIYCGPDLPPTKTTRLIFNTVVQMVGPTLQVYFQPSLSPGAIEFRSRDGSIMASIVYRGNEYGQEVFMLLKAPTLARFK